MKYPSSSQAEYEHCNRDPPSLPRVQTEQVHAALAEDIHNLGLVFWSLFLKQNYVCQEMETREVITSSICNGGNDCTVEAHCKAEPTMYWERDTISDPKRLHPEKWNTSAQNCLEATIPGVWRLLDSMLWKDGLRHSSKNTRHEKALTSPTATQVVDGLNKLSIDGSNTKATMDRLGVDCVAEWGGLGLGVSSRTWELARASSAGEVRQVEV
jgi:hypothetical protein